MASEVIFDEKTTDLAAARTETGVPDEKSAAVATAADNALKDEVKVKEALDYDINPDSNEVISSAADIVTHVIDVQDDPNINPWTFRMVFLGETSLSLSLSLTNALREELLY